MFNSNHFESYLACVNLVMTELLYESHVVLNYLDS